MNNIGIAEVLADTHRTHDGTTARQFSLTYYKDDGSIGSIGKAARNVKSNVKVGGATTNLRQNDLMLVYDHEANSHKYITVSLIRTYNGTRVFH